MARHNMFLKLTGQTSGRINGESTEPGHEQEIAVVDWGWGMTSPTSIGSGHASGRVRFDTLRIEKEADTSSTALMSVMNTNEISREAVLSVRKAAGGSGTSSIDYFVVRLESARIISFKIESQMSAEGRPYLSERIEFTFRSIEIEFTAQSETGEAEGGSLFVGDAYSDD